MKAYFLAWRDWAVNFNGFINITCVRQVYWFIAYTLVGFGCITWSYVHWVSISWRLTIFYPTAMSFVSSLYCYICSEYGRLSLYGWHNYIIIYEYSKFWHLKDATCMLDCYFLLICMCTCKNFSLYRPIYRATLKSLAWFKDFIGFANLIFFHARGWGIDILALHAFLANIMYSCMHAWFTFLSHIVIHYTIVLSCMHAIIESSVKYYVYKSAACIYSPRVLHWQTNWRSDGMQGNNIRLDIYNYRPI